MLLFVSNVGSVRGVCVAVDVYDVYADVCAHGDIMV